MFEEINEKMTLLAMLKDSILERMNDNHKTPEEVVSKMFNEIDADESGELSKREFRVFLSLLDINFSNEKFNRLFKTVDVNLDGGISKLELCRMVFPDMNDNKIKAMSATRPHRVSMVRIICSFMSIIIFALVGAKLIWQGKCCE